MRMSVEARAARKKQQLARLEKKGSPEYPTLFASQPEEVEKAAKQGAERAAIRRGKNALELARIAAAQGAVSVFSGAPGQMATKQSEG